MGRGWKRARKLSTASVPYPTVVELFFRWIKRPLRIKAFFGTSANAVKT
jgi:hypothetical protein